MRKQFRAGMLALALLGSVSFAAAQNTPGGASGAQEKLNLSQSKEQQVTQGLTRETPQSAPGYQGAVGSTPPGSLAQKSLPNDVTDQVPETIPYSFGEPKTKLFRKTDAGWKIVVITIHDASTELRM